jgi:hypothetical protein
VLFDMQDAHRKRVLAVGEAGKTRWFYILSRRDGKLLRLSQGLAPNRNVYDNPPNGAPDKPLPLRGTIGPISYDPQRHLAFITEIERPYAQRWRDDIVAVNVETGKIAWKKTLGNLHAGSRGDPVLAGSLSTSGLVFVSDPDGHFVALDPATGITRWHYQLGTHEDADLNESWLQRFAHHIRDSLLPIKRRFLRQNPPTEATAGVDTSPIVYEINGREYIAIAYDAQPERAVGGATICVFALADS